MDFATALTSSWPFLVVCIVALAVVWWTLKSSIATLHGALGQLNSTQAKLNSKLDEMDRRVEQIGARQSDFSNRVAACEDALRKEQDRTANQPPPSSPERPDSEQPSEALVAASPESMERFDAATQTLSQLAQELNGFETRQSENWRRIKGDLDEQSFQLQRVQQHMDRLFADAPAPQ